MAVIYPNFTPTAQLAISKSQQYAQIFGKKTVGAEELFFSIVLEETDFTTFFLSCFKIQEGLIRS